MEETSPDYVDDGFEIKVSVVNPQVRGTSKYVVYTIRGQDKNGTFESVRRYSDFDSVKNIMLVRWPGCYIPSLPSKKIMGNMDAHFVEERRMGLEEFLRLLSSIKHLWYCEEAQLLIRSQTPDLDKVLAPFAKPNNAEIIARYEQNFTYLSGKEINVSIEAKINQFSIYLKKVVPMLRIFKEMSSNMITVRKKYSEQEYTLMQYMLPEYEKNCLKEYTGSEESLVFLNTKEAGISEAQTKLREFGTKHQFEQLFQNFRREKREVEAFLETMKVKEDYDNAKEKAKHKVKELELEKQKVMAGKQSITSMIRSKSKDDNLRDVELEIQQAQKEESELTHICDISTVLLGYIEIDKFKKLRQLSYYTQLKQMAKFEHDYAKTQHDLWQSILNSDSVQRVEKTE